MTDGVGHRLMHPSPAAPAVAGPPHHLAQREDAAAFHRGIPIGDQEQLALRRLVVGQVHHGELAAVQVPRASAFCFPPNR
ncbi:hypothetical protein [Xanthobacter dioxanivorans]|uniref:hypothetical protein n=1 Tax=Xanthobacter dioxanivorans TaxID=2528964 RepID=UPI001AED545B|nr:hypothetical protein [Xanthobacter dioxanivorans]